MLGGTVRQADGGIVGSHAVSLIGQFRVDLAIIGTSAIDADGTLLDFDIREVQAARAIIEHARKVVLVADSSKFSRSAPVRVAHLSEIDMFVTDRLPSAAIADLCRVNGVEVVEAGGPIESENEEWKVPPAATAWTDGGRRARRVRHLGSASIKLARCFRSDDRYFRLRSRLSST